MNSSGLRYVVGQDRCGTVFYHIHSNFLWKKLLLVNIFIYQGKLLSKLNCLLI